MLKSKGVMGRDDEPTNAYGARQALARQLPSAGDLVASKYRLERQIGRGGMSIVFSARHNTLRQRVAIKFLSLEQDDSGAAVARFLHEGRAAAKIRSEHVARVIDVDVTGAGLPYMVMEYLEGRDLAQLLEQRGPLPIERAVDYVMQALEAVAEAHTLKIVHRDLKPANLFVIRRADGKKEIKVIDFGISKSLGDSEQTAFTRAHSLLGSPQYMSPEQALTPTDIDHRTDLWSMGIVVYELVAGACPFEGETYLEILKKVTAEEAPALTSRCAAAPPELERVMRRCLQRDREFRFQNADELARALLPFGSRQARISYDTIVGVSLSRDEHPTSSPALVPNDVLVREGWTTNCLVASSDFGEHPPPSLEHVPIVRRASVGADDRKSDKSACALTQPSAGAPEELREQYDAQRLADSPRAAVPQNDPKQERAPTRASDGAIPVGSRRPLIDFALGAVPSLENEVGPSSSGESWIHVARNNRGTFELESAWARAVRLKYKKARRAARAIYRMVGEHPLFFGLGALLALAIAAVLFVIGMRNTESVGAITPAAVVTMGRVSVADPSRSTAKSWTEAFIDSNPASAPKSAAVQPPRSRPQAK